MNDQNRSKEELVAELARLRQRVAELEASESEWRRGEVALRESEQALREARDELEQRVRDRMAELLSANQRLEREIDERGRAEQALQQSHDELKAIHDGMVDGLLVADAETKEFRRANLSICRMLGYSEAELLSMSVTDIHRTDDLPGVLATFQAQAEGRLALSENIPVLQKDGTVFLADIASKQVIYRDRPCVIGFFRDVTERRQAYEALQRGHRVLRQLLNAQDRERQLIAYEIHDGLAQQLTAATMQFQASHQLSDDSPEKASAAYEAVVEMLRQALAEARRLISGLRPPILDESGIAAAIAHLVHDVMSQGGPDVEFHSSGQLNRLEPLLENAIFRITQEGLTNAHRHSESDKARIELLREEDCVHIEIRDWGIGFDPDGVEERCFGLAGIRERARVLGGHTAIRSAPGEGTRIVVRLPLRVSEADLG